MTDNKQQSDITQEIASNHKPSRSKRLLLKGAAAVPVVLTLRSGAAFALSSSAEMCIKSDNKAAGDAPPAILVNADSGDPSVRRRLSCRKLSKINAMGQVTGQKIYVYKDIPVAGASSDMTDWQGDRNIHGDPDNKVYSVDSFISPYFIESGTGTKYQSEAPFACDALVYITPDNPYPDMTAPIVGNADLTADGLPYIMESCWSSVSPGTGNPI